MDTADKAKQVKKIIIYFDDKGNVVPKEQATNMEIREGSRSTLARIQKPDPVTKSRVIRY